MVKIVKKQNHIVDLEISRKGLTHSKTTPTYTCVNYMYRVKRSRIITCVLNYKVNG